MVARRNRPRADTGAAKTAFASGPKKWTSLWLTPTRDNPGKERQKPPPTHRISQQTGTGSTTADNHKRRRPPTLKPKKQTEPATSICANPNCPPGVCKQSLRGGNGKARTARLWAYGCDKHPWGSAIRPNPHRPPIAYQTKNPPFGGFFNQAVRLRLRSCGSR